MYLCRSHQHECRSGQASLKYECLKEVPSEKPPQLVSMTQYFGVSGYAEARWQSADRTIQIEHISRH
ncbi:uncharacterized protein H6S33_001786 [Morchella sextelata]|uniref:uncharacterized protein n=1 Tax=Morchella sextelata TaxID=1174677 RepID=UPI001D04C497|nr:uncharacterized protein H6S33_001786 [Morchella sextelata]KAH0608652.1 hypothetical protein H6S33_001786 [Morchella sextelata]